MSVNRDMPQDFLNDEIGSERLGETPVEEAPERHPLSAGRPAEAAGVGAVLGAVAGGALAGTVVGGPIGTVVGAAVGALAGGFGGKALSEHDASEDAHWREHISRQPYFVDGMHYDDYAPALRLGREWRERYPTQEFEDIEPEVAKEYERSRGESRLGWDQARPATIASWDRMTE